MNLESLRPHPPNICLICNNNILKRSYSNNNSPEAGSKLVQIFARCLLIEIPVAWNFSFCFTCETILEEWEHCWNQILKFSTATKVIQATLTARILESQKVDVGSNVDLIRKQVKQKYNATVPLKRLNLRKVHLSSAADRNDQITLMENGYSAGPVSIQSRISSIPQQFYGLYVATAEEESNQANSLSALSQIVQESSPAKIGSIGCLTVHKNNMPGTLQTENTQQKAASSSKSSASRKQTFTPSFIKHVAPNTFCYKGEYTFRRTPKAWRCNHCTYAVNVKTARAQKSMITHMRAVHVASSTQEPSNVTQGPEAEAMVDEYLGIPVHLIDGKYKCGDCGMVSEAKRNARGQINRHIREKHSSGAWETVRVKYAGEGQYMYREKFPFSFDGQVFQCGLCPDEAIPDGPGAQTAMLKHIDRHHGDPLLNNTTEEINPALVSSYSMSAEDALEGLRNDPLEIKVEPDEIKIIPDFEEYHTGELMETTATDMGDGSSDLGPNGSEELAFYEYLGVRVDVKDGQHICSVCSMHLPNISMCQVHIRSAHSVFNINSGGIF